MNALRDALEKVADSLLGSDEGRAHYVRGLTKATPQAIADDLAIWGGAGSLMDSAHFPSARGEPRRHFEAAAIMLGHELVGEGARNGRMERWIEVFEIWQRDGV